MNNDDNFHVGAALLRKKHIVRIGANSRKTHPGCEQLHNNGEVTHFMHAETNVLRFAESGDTLVVLRFLKGGWLTMSKPCSNCERKIIGAGIKRVVYSDWNGNLREIKY